MSPTALARTPLSSIRARTEDFRHLIRRHSEPGDSEDQTALMSSENLANEPWKKLPLSTIDPVTLRILFETIRDQQPLKDRQGQVRRITWLYPDDGCYARSTLTHSALATLTPEDFHQIFVFGNLQAETQNHPSGRVYWWYHVVPLIRTAVGTFVIDPALDPYQPLSIEQWLRHILPESEQEAKVSLCAPSTYGPESLCHGESSLRVSDAIQEETETYLDLEWERIQSLGRDPAQELGPHATRNWFPVKQLNDLIILNNFNQLTKRSLYDQSLWFTQIQR